MFYYPYIDPVAIHIGSLQIRWYGIMYLLGFLATWWLGRKRLQQSKQRQLTANGFDDFLFYGILGVIFGGRMGYILFYQTSTLLRDPLHLLRIWEGGMSFHGGLIGVIIATIIFVRRHHLNFFYITDLIAPLTPIGLGLGRIGNFINGELWGQPTTMFWGIRVPCNRFPIECADLMPDAIWSQPLHPSQLYEASLEGLGLFLLLRWFTSKPQPLMASSGLFLISYSLARGLVEFVRQPDSQLGFLAFGWLTMGQILTIPMLLSGIIIFITAYIRKASGH
jgi:phosphatidylglycerol:prolipoprotein diacylglycerol transferase